MKNINVYGNYQPNRFNQVLDHHQPELAAYLAKARGPESGRLPHHQPAAAVRRGGARGLHRIRRRPQSRPGPPLADAAERRLGLDQGNDLARRLPAPRRRRRLRRQSVVRRGDAEQDHVGRQDRRQDRRHQAVPGRRPERHRRQCPRAHARRQRDHLVQRLDAQGRARQDRPEDREGRGLHAARGHVPHRRPGDRSTSTARAASGRERSTARCASIP